MHPPTASSYLILQAGFLIDPPLQVICQSYVPLLLRSENNLIENDAELQITYIIITLTLDPVHSTLFHDLGVFVYQVAM